MGSAAPYGAPGSLVERLCLGAATGACAETPSVTPPATLCVAVETGDPGERMWARARTTAPPSLLTLPGLGPDDVETLRLAIPIAANPAVVGAFEVAIDLHAAPPALGDVPAAVAATAVQAGDLGDARKGARCAG